MAYTDDAVQAKLSALNETQESIVTVAQWVMFHRRYADRTAASWLQRLKDSGSNKRLNLVYLANEVAQQSRVRKKDDFIIAFSPILAEATATAYKGASYEIQQKLRRVVEVWRDRKIFEVSIQEAIEARIDELDKTKSSGRKFGGSLLSSSGSAPKELQPVVSQQIAVNKATAATVNATQTASTEYEKLTDPTKTAPPPPVHAARLSALLKQLASAEIAVNESIKARKALIEGMEKLVETNKVALAQEESEHLELASRKTTMEARRREVEDNIMRGLSADDGSPTSGGGPVTGTATTNGTGTPGHDGASVEPERPQPEELTPPPVESFTPVGSPKPEPTFIPADGAPHLRHTHPDARGPPAPPALFSPTARAPSATLNTPDGIATATPVRAHSGSPGAIGPAKRRRLDDEYAGFGSGDAMADLDDDVAELLRAESGGN